MIRILLGLSLIPTLLFAQATDDNEVWIDQEGDTLTLYIDQIGFGNKIGADDFSNGSPGTMSIVGSSLTFDLDFFGNQNLLYGPLTADSSTYNLSFTGDSNDMDWNIGYIGSADDSTFDITVTGDSNTWDFDLGYNQSAESFDYDLTLVGGTNVFTTLVDSDNVKWELDLTGDGNDFNTTQKDADQSLVVEYSGDDGNIDIVQQSGTCPQGVTSCSGVINLDITSDDATITINQKDTSD